MVSDTVNQIILTEKQADENLELARKKAEQIVFEANAEAESMIKKAQFEAEQEADFILQKNRLQIESVITSGKKTEMESITEIQRKAQEKMGQAADLVIAKLIPQK